MILGRTLSVYFSGRFIKAILGLFLFAAVMLFLFDVLELVRRGRNRLADGLVQCS